MDMGKYLTQIKTFIIKDISNLVYHHFMEFFSLITSNTEERSSTEELKEWESILKVIFL